MPENVVRSQDLNEFKIKVHEPFAEFLMADPDEYNFSISLLDVVRFAGHACPSMVGAFLIAQRAIKELFPENQTCERGQVAIEIPASVEQGPIGPISNVFAMIFGSWEKSGFGGLQGQFRRRGLLKYDAADVPPGTYRFHNLKTHEYVDITYDPSLAPIPAEARSLPFQKQWRMKITSILHDPDQYIHAKKGKHS